MLRIRKGDEPLKVLVVSGFLGAGKTTFIRTLLKRTGIYAAVLENEYGETDLDGREIRKESPLQVLEFMEGCVCCTKKDSFANSVIAISAGLDPDWLIVEPSGVGKLGAILDNIRRVSYEKIVPAGSILVIAPRSFQTVLNEFHEIFEDQMRHADTIVLSKTETEEASVVEDVVRRIRAYNRNAPVLTTHYTDQDDDWWQQLLHMADTADAADQSSRPAGKDSQPDVDDAASPLDQITFRTARVRNPGDLTVFLEDILHGLFGGIVRAKGVLYMGGEPVRFDVADGLYAVTGEEESNVKTQCVFIGQDMREDALRERLRAYETVRMRRPDRNRKEETT